MALIFCFAAHNKVVTMLPATVAAISTLAIPVVGLLSSAWLLRRAGGLREVAALALVLGAMALVLLPPQRASEAAVDRTRNASRPIGQRI